LTHYPTVADLARTPGELRDEVEALVRDDLIGPLGGEQEELLDAPVDQYLLGLLAPRRGNADAPGPPEDELATAVSDDSGAEGHAEDRPAAVEQLVPSAFGMTFALEPGCTRLLVDARWGAYSRETSDEKLDRGGKPARVWRRRACGGEHPVEIPAAGEIAAFRPDVAEEEVVVRGLVRDRGPQRLVTLFLLNGQQTDPGARSVERWLVQAQLAVRAPDDAAVFVRRGIDVVELAPEVDRDEVAGLEMLHRSTVELAGGHGVAVEAEPAPGAPDRGVRVATTVMPAEEVPLTEAPVADDFASEPEIAEPFARALEALDMQRLAEAPRERLGPLLAPLADAYEAWIARQEQRVDDPEARLAGHEAAAVRHLADARTAASRIRAGIAALEDPDVAEAFAFANHAMWQQRVHAGAAEARRRDDRLRLHDAVAAADVPGNRSWRPFQLAFVLLNVPSLADPTHPERTGAQDRRLVDLLFFPTGGGKTEAYLGLTAFTLAIRRLQGTVAGRSGHEGVAVLMRYTLRLLTLQQFQRAAALLCACELRRRKLHGDGRTAQQRRWGATPMRIGLWVGRASTPNRTEDAAEWVRQARQGYARGASPMQLARCPWCGSELASGRDLSVDAVRGRTVLSCSDTGGECPFTPRDSPDEGLPVVVVEEEVYRLLPALVIATVDKFARMPWEGRVQALFGQVSRRCERHGFLTPAEEAHPGSHPAAYRQPRAQVVECEPLRPPDLIIQDELHLISGPLGSLVGLYETAVDALCAWRVDGKAVRPKVIASTATIRRAGQQVARLFDRRLAVFPPPGLDARDSFFALQRDRPAEIEQRPGRCYLGVCAPGRRFKQVLIRTYVAQLEAAWTVLGRQPGPAADAYMTLVGYFNSLRELGGMRRLTEDDVQNRLFHPGREGRGRLVIEELTSRKSAADIPRTLDQLGVERLSVARPAAAPKGRFNPRSIDVLLATNMISVGVDVPRLGAMVVAGQPKSTSEYIQATSRIGRQYKGLVMTVYNWDRPRDLSHYETFGHYHRTLYRQVEALSVTPFAPRALDRGLTGVLASLLRLSGPDYNDNAGARRVDPASPRAVRTRTAISERAGVQLGSAGAAALDHRLSVQLDEWGKAIDVGQRTLFYRARGKSDTDVSLLLEPDLDGWTTWTVPTSMRNVEPAVPLALRERGIAPAGEDWEAPERAAPPPPDPEPAG
ncbi:MAG: DISARM system helicase DrmA, partial [Solirubrobacteraceae bacterium]